MLTTTSMPLFKWGKCATFITVHDIIGVQSGRRRWCFNQLLQSFVFTKSVDTCCGSAALCINGTQFATCKRPNPNIKQQQPKWQSNGSVGRVFTRLYCGEFDCCAVRIRDRLVNPDWYLQLHHFHLCVVWMGFMLYFVTCCQVSNWNSLDFREMIVMGGHVIER